MSTDDDSASGVYTGQVADIIAAEPRASSYQPAKPVELFVKHRRTPTSVADLGPIERMQFERMWKGQDADAILRDGDEETGPLDVEVATVVDEHGTPRYTLWGWHYGVVYLMDAAGVDCLAFACQHDLEHWHADQRELFWAMDRAMRRNDHGFRQPMKFCWWEDKCWAEIADLPKGNVQSEAYVRAQFAGEN
jgi:hypothetical protein